MHNPTQGTRRYHSVASSANTNGTFWHIGKCSIYMALLLSMPLALLMRRRSRSARNRTHRAPPKKACALACALSRCSGASNTRPLSTGRASSGQREFHTVCAGARRITAPNPRNILGFAAMVVGNYHIGRIEAPPTSKACPRLRVGILGDKGGARSKIYVKAADCLEHVTAVTSRSHAAPIHPPRSFGVAGVHARLNVLMVIGKSVGSKQFNPLFPAKPIWGSLNISRTRSM